MQEWFKKTVRLISYALRGFLSRHKKRLMLVGALALAFIVIGVIAPASPGEKSVNYIIIMRNEGAFNVIGAYFKTMLSFLLCFAVIFIGVVVSKLRCLAYIAVAFVAYRFGSILNCAVSEDAASGAVYIIVYLVPVYLTLIATMITALCMVSEICPGVRGRSPVCMSVVKDYSVRLAVCFAVNCALGVIFSIIVPSIVKLIVIV